jgi:predicted O-methyltransferase YrrM
VFEGGWRRVLLQGIKQKVYQIIKSIINIRFKVYYIIGSVKKIRVLDVISVEKYLINEQISYEKTVITNSNANSIKSKRLTELSMQAISEAHSVDIASVANRFTGDTKRFIMTWPGEHYKLLAALVKIINPKLVVEIGTLSGASCLAMKHFLSPEGKIVTYDIIPWIDFKETGLRKEDFDGRLEQRIVDISKKSNFKKEFATIKEADMIFIDAAKDGIMEGNICNYFDIFGLNKNPIVIFDDILFLNMVKTWESIKYPKFDITSFGHWSGTGLVDWGVST